MNPARLLVLGIALVAGVVAAYLASGTSEAPAPAPVVQQSIRTTDVLVAAVEIPLGSTITGKELRWQTWPADGTSPGMVTKAEQPNALTEFGGAIARMAMIPGEPIRTEKIIKANQGGVMSALLPSGSRALAITIDNRGANTAGGFILPNDRVDVIRTSRDEAASKVTGTDVFVSETLLRNVRVLAIGQNIQERNGEKVVVGETATLELDPRQVEIISLAQRLGQLSLSLRSLQDANKADNVAARTDDDSLTIVRYGTASQR
ncbi:Flp pilus assembly protein CpaB [Alsobacter sp. R-9]